MSHERTDRAGGGARPERKRYEPPELVRLAIRVNGDNVLGGCKVNVSQSTNSAPSATCDTCSNLGS